MRYLGRCDSIACVAQFRASEPGKYGLNNGHGAYEILALCGLCRNGFANSAQCGTRDDLALPAHAVAAGRLQLPSPADLLGLWRRGDRAFRAVGRRMDDAGAAIALPALGYLGYRQRAADKTAGRTMVHAMAVRAMARCQRTVKTLLRGFRAGTYLARKRVSARTRRNLEAARQGLSAAACEDAVVWAAGIRPMVPMTTRQNSLNHQVAA